MGLAADRVCAVQQQGRLHRRLAMGLTGLLVCAASAVFAGDAPATTVEVLSIDDVKVGAVGVGKTVLEGTEIVPFQVKILGVLKNVAPGRDLVLSRLSGANLEHTGVIAGMSGSPVYIDGKLLGAVAYAWPYAKEPIAGITPFSQMRDSAQKPTPAELAAVSSWSVPATAENGMPWGALDLSRSASEIFSDPALSAPSAVSRSKLGDMQAISVPLSAAGFASGSLEQLGRELGPLGMVPMATGGVAAGKLPKGSIVPGAPLAVGLISGDMEMSGIGTVTHVEGGRVWGWGHPFMQSGRAQYLLRAGIIHVVNPRLSVSSKMGSPLEVLGTIDSDVGTCVAGELGDHPDMLPVTLDIRQPDGGPEKQCNVEVVRHPRLLAPLVASVIRSAVEELGQLPSEVTIDLDAVVEADGLKPIVLKNTYSGSAISGSDGVVRMLSQVATITNGLARNPFEPATLEAIHCKAEIRPVRSSAAITAARLDSDTLEPGDLLKARVALRPHKGEVIEREICLKLPENLPPGDYVASVCDASSHLKHLFNEQPQLMQAQSLSEVAQVYRNQLQDNWQTLYLRVPLKDRGLTVDGVSLPHLPASAAAVFTSSRASSKKAIRHAMVTRESCPWTVEGETSLKFKVVQTKQTSALDD